MPVSPITNLLEEALTLHRRGAVAEAAARYAEVLRADPANTDANFYLAMISCQHGRFDEGAALARKSLASDPRHGRAHVLLGRALNALGQQEEALASFERAIALAPDLAQAHGNRGDVLSDLGRNAEAVDSYDRALALAPDSVEDWFNRGVALSAIDRHNDAISSFDRAVAGKPDYAQAHLWRAKLLVELRRPSDALEAVDKVIAIEPSLAEGWLGRSNVLTALNRYEEALVALDRALTLQADLAEAWLGRGKIFTALKRYDDAFAAYDRALELKPDLAETWLGRGNAYMAVGQSELAIHAASRALELKETLQTKAFFARCVRLTKFTADNDGRFRSLVLRALSEAWARPRELANVCINLIKLDGVVNEAITRANSAWPARLAAAELLGSSGMAALSHNQLLRCLLECQPVTDIGFERLLANVRFAMLTTSTADDAWDERLLDFYCAVARQCFVNEYVFSTTEVEADQAQRLRASLEKALAAGGPCSALWPVVVGAYFPLHSLTESEALLGRAWPQCVDALIVQQVKEPAQERLIAATMPVLTSIDDEVSRLVRQQYEEDPYPRWVKAGPPARPPVLNDRRPDEVLDVLIAGCGTGLFTIEFARQAPQARILAIDLSVASLSYAKRMAQSLGLANIDFGQADIVRLTSIERTFDFIDVSGVLHHLADPWAGWRVLLSLLRPGGVMQVGLYSALARRSIVAARELIANRGYRPILEDIRRCREEIMATDDGSLLKSVTNWADFFATNECRDLLFHAQEHRITLPEIKSFLAANNAQFAGFILDAATLQKFAARFPEQAALTDLDRWQAFEIGAPETFAGMYQFAVRKPPLSADATTGTLH